VGKMFHVEQSFSAIYAVIGVMLILLLSSACGARLANPEGWSPPLELTDSILLAQVDRGRISGIDISESCFGLFQKYSLKISPTKAVVF
jgi:hypothetical protein